MVRDLPVDTGAQLEHLIRKSIDKIQCGEEYKMESIQGVPFTIKSHGEKGSKGHLTLRIYISYSSSNNCPNVGTLFNV
jgi:hypothetical protein